MSAKPPLLFLCHRIPYPPNKGDKIRSWHLLDWLADHFAVYLATFVDDPADHRYEDTVRGRCADALFLPLAPRRARLLSALALLKGEALSLAYYRSAALQRWADERVAAHAIERALVFCSPMAQYLRPGTGAGERVRKTVIDLVDVDSDKWRQYAASRPWPLSAVYAREARTLLKAEREAAGLAVRTFLVSEREATLFRTLAPGAAERVSHFNNGVDSCYFRPRPEQSTPYAEDELPLVFTGAMDYWPNVDAVTWFAHEVLPLVRARNPRVAFYIVGSKPTPAVVKLAELPGVTVTGRVEDVRPYLQFALAAVAPLRIARGVQNKVLEAMAMARPVLSSSAGLEGIAAEHGKTVLCCDSPVDYVAALERLIANEYDKLGVLARALVEEQFNWARNIAPAHEALR
ncbi:MAG: TIGR03087 family PEP-CTERM/XrtA system glycosyltransferase [Pseudohaliea sp.]